ncbi:recombination protein NinG [Escherichia coli]|nr:recombination protein NinG [Escherichia coli]
MAKPARRKCKICKEWFHPAFSNQWWCMPGTRNSISTRTTK